jgi:hypothetical protein
MNDTTTLHNLNATLILRLENADNEDEAIELKVRDSLATFLECNAPAKQLAAAFIENYYPHLFITK